MKKFLFTLSAITAPLLGNPPPVENPDTESPPDLTSPVYSIPDAPVRDRVEKKPWSTKQKSIFAVAGTIATITIGLLVSGSNTGKHIKPGKSSDTKS